MSDNPKIMVFQLKELIYTLIFIVLGILLIFLLVYMFLHNDDEEAADTSYTPGTYSSAMTIGSIPVEVSVKVDSDRIIDIERREPRHFGHEKHFGIVPGGAFTQEEERQHDREHQQ